MEVSEQVDTDELLEQLEVAARAAHDHHSAYEAEIERRDELILRAYDTGMPRYRIAHAARLSETRCNRIVADKDDG